MCCLILSMSKDGSLSTQLKLVIIYTTTGDVGKENCRAATINGLIIFLSIKRQETAKNSLKVSSSNFLFCPTNSPKTNIQMTLLQIRERKQILAFEKL